MPGNENWRFQGRQYHQWFGHGTAPGGGDQAGEELFKPERADLRVQWAAHTLVARVPRADQHSAAATFDGERLDRLRATVAAWYAASRLQADAFDRVFAPLGASETAVVSLRRAAGSMVEARSHAELELAGQDLAKTVAAVGIGNWPRFLAAAEQRAVAAAVAGEVPGFVKASAADAGAGVALILFLLTLGVSLGPRPSTEVKPLSGLSMMTEEVNPPKKEISPASPVPQLAKPGDATLPDDRRAYILEGDGRGGGGHGPGRGRPGKSEFPADWSDEKVIEAVREVANDPASVRSTADGGRTAVEGRRDGVEIRVIVGRDGKTIVTAHPTNVPPNGDQ